MAYLASLLLKVVLLIVGLAVAASIMACVAGWPLLTLTPRCRAWEAQAFYCPPSSRAGFLWLPVIGSAAMGAYVAIPFGWHIFWNDPGWALSVFFKDGNALALLRLLAKWWFVPAALAALGFICRVLVVRSFWKGALLLLWFLSAGYFSFIAYAFFLAAALVPTLCGLLVAGGFLKMGGTMFDAAQEEATPEFATLDDGTKLKRYGTGPWMDESGEIWTKDGREFSKQS
ncbi:MAG: hypothetical protein IKH04_03825 [Kiritimatiellae bacterium]|nr:hypothetical protein [Kiritimatiellia bacterium]